MGKTQIACSSLSAHIETPPRAWGRLYCFLQIHNSKGNTPTCMGKTSFLIVGSGHEGKHPHVHGEDSVIYQII